MEALYIQPLGEDGLIVGEQEEGREKASSPTNSITEEETDEDSEPEPPQVSRRKVSFADAFGLNLVSVKEFDNVEGSEVVQPPENKAAHPLEEFYMSCLFTVPSSPEELDHRLQAHMVELESIELLPGTTTLRGIVRVVNLCYSKAVYARVTLDRWTSFFELLAEYVPGSSDRKTDRFSFNYTLVPPVEREGTRVEVCLRYETSLGTFWANNNEMNYVLFCHKKGHAKENVPQVPEESGGCKSKRSCLKANRRGSAEEKPGEASNPLPAAAEAEATHDAEEANRQNSTHIQSLLKQEEHKALVDGIKNRHRAARLARVQDYLSQRRQRMPKAYSHDSTGQKASQPLPAPRADSAIFLHKRQKKQPGESAQVLTYHQIPLLTLDWNSDPAHRWGPTDVDDLCAGGAEMSLSQASQSRTDSSPVSETWGGFLNGSDDTTDKETSVCAVWQEFLNGPSCADRSAVPESEWLQTAASVSPSSDKEPIKYAASSQEPECEADMDTAGCVNSPGGDNTGPQGASLTSSVTHAQQGVCLKGATPASQGSCGCSTEYQREGDGAEPSALHTADSVRSSGESESQNATAVDRISGLDEEVTGSAHNVMDDTLAFRGTIRTGTKDGERREVNNCTEKKVSTHEERFRPQETAECEMSLRCADGKQHERNSGNPLQQNESGEKEIKPVQTNTDKFKQSQEESQSEDAASDSRDLMRKTERPGSIQSRPIRAEQEECETLEKQQGINPPLQTRQSDTDPCEPKAVEEAEMRRAHLKGQRDEIRPEDAQVETKRDTPTELHPETLGGKEEDVSEAEDDRVRTGNAPAPLREQQGSAEVESSPRVERTEDPITAGSAAALQVMESGRFIERFGEDLVRRIWEEVFGWREQAFSRDTDGRHHLLFEKHFTDDFDSGVFSLTELPTEINLAAESSEHSPEETGSDSNAHLSQDFIPILAAQSRQSSTESASPEAPQIYAQVRQTGERVEAHSSKLKECDAVGWWSVLYILSHITRLVTCSLLVAGFFFMVFLYDFPAPFALYLFSVCCWFYKWKRHQVMTNKRLAG